MPRIQLLRLLCCCMPLSCWPLVLSADIAAALVRHMACICMQQGSYQAGNKQGITSTAYTPQIPTACTALQASVPQATPSRPPHHHQGTCIAHTMHSKARWTTRLPTACWRHWPLLPQMRIARRLPAVPAQRSVFARPLVIHSCMHGSSNEAPEAYALRLLDTM